jgi:NADH-quinone oxidoreductase subunit B
VAEDQDVTVSILELGLACCALEVEAAVSGGLLLPLTQAGPEKGSPVNLLLVAGTITDALAPAVLRAWESLGPPRAAISFGACSTSAGPYWDAPTVTKGVDQLLPVEVYVPGCPPRPEALIAALLRVASGHLPTVAL